MGSWCFCLVSRGVDWEANLTGGTEKVGHTQNARNHKIALMHSTMA